MQAYDYKAIDASGKKIKGTVMAASARAARSELKAKQLTLVEMKETGAAKRARVSASGSGKEKSGKLKPKDLTRATRQLAVLVKSGTPVSEALSLTAQQFEGSSMRAALLDIRTDILEGRSLSRAMARDGRFSELYCSMVEAGENAGHLASVLERLANYLENAQKVRRKVMGATAYPIVLSIFAVLVLSLLMVVVVPKVVAQFNALGQDLPTLTKMIIGLADFMKAWGLWLLAGLVFAVLIFRQAMKIEAFRRRVDAFILRVPYTGKLNRDMNAARFARTMAGLLESGTPALSSLRTARNTLNNLIMRDGVDKVIEQVRGGTTISAALKQAKSFPPLMVQMVAGGEHAGELGQMFGLAAEYMEGEFEAQTDIVLNLLAPAIIILLGGAVLVIVAAIFLPILQLNTMVY